MSAALPPLYAILSADLYPGDSVEWARRLADAGVELIQYRNKHATSRGLFDVAKTLSALAGSRGFRFILNDRPDIALLTGGGGVHLGQQDLPVEAARRICGASCWVGVSTHNLEQLRAAAASSADYIAVGPVFTTGSKANPDPVVGLEFIRHARALTTKPLVAIGGISSQRAAEVYAAGADSVAVISDLAQAADLPSRVRAYLETSRGRV